VCATQLHALFTQHDHTRDQNRVSRSSCRQASAVHDGYTPRSSRVMARKVAEAVSTVSVMWGVRCEVSGVMW